MNNLLKKAIFACLLAALGIGSSRAVAEDDPGDDPWEGYEYDDAGDSAPESEPQAHHDFSPAFLVAHFGHREDSSVDLDRDGALDDQAPTAADPVILASGELIHGETDLHVAGPGIADLVFHRTYRSRSDLRSPLGSNWFHNHDIRLLWGRGAVKASLPGACGFDDDVCVVLRREGVDAIYLRPPGSSFYAPLNGDGSLVRVNHEAVSGRPSLGILEFPDGAKMMFDRGADPFERQVRGFLTRPSVI